MAKLASLWLDTAGRSARPALTEELRVDVCVVGAGISAGGGGKRLQHREAELAARAHLLAARAQARWRTGPTHGAANERGIERVHEITAELGIDCELRRKPNLVHTESEDGREDRVVKRAGLESIEPGEGRVVGAGLGQRAVYRDEDGTLHALSARCTHLGCIVNWNSGEGTWDCPCHGFRFGARGEVIMGPAVSPLEPREL